MKRRGERKRPNWRPNDHKERALWKQRGVGVVKEVTEWLLFEILFLPHNKQHLPDFWEFIIFQLLRVRRRVEQAATLPPSYSLVTRSIFVFYYIFRHASVSSTYPCPSVSWSVSWSHFRISNLWSHRGWCTGVDAPGMMHREWCTRDDAPGMMHRGWCTRDDAHSKVYLSKIYQK